LRLFILPAKQQDPAREQFGAEALRIGWTQGACQLPDAPKRALSSVHVLLAQETRAEDVQHRHGGFRIFIGKRGEALLRLPEKIHRTERFANSTVSVGIEQDGDQKVFDFFCTLLFSERFMTLPGDQRGRRYESDEQDRCGDNDCDVTPDEHGQPV